MVLVTKLPVTTNQDLSTHIESRWWCHLVETGADVYITIGGFTFAK